MDSSRATDRGRGTTKPSSTSDKAAKRNNKDHQKGSPEQEVKLSSLPDPKLVPIEVSGNLHKQGRLLKKWKPRFFQIQGSCLYYFKNYEKKECLGLIDLTKCYFCGKSSAASFGCAFEIQTWGRVHLLAARDDKEAEKWINIVKKKMAPEARERDKKGSKGDVSAAIPTELRTRRATIKMNRSGKRAGEGIKPSSSAHEIEIKRLTENELGKYENTDSSVTTSTSVPEFQSNKIDNDPSIYHEIETGPTTNNNSSHNQYNNTTEESEEYVEKATGSKINTNLEYEEIELQKQPTIHPPQRLHQQTSTSANQSFTAIKKESEENEEYVLKASATVKGDILEYGEIQPVAQQSKNDKLITSQPAGGTAPSLYDTPPDAKEVTNDEPPPVPIRRGSIRSSQDLQAGTVPPPAPPRHLARNERIGEQPKRKQVKRAQSVVDMELPPPIPRIQRSHSVSEDILPPLLDASTFFQMLPNQEISELPPPIDNVTTPLTSSEFQLNADDLPPAIGPVSDVTHNEYSAMEFQLNADNLPPAIGDIDNITQSKDNEYSAIEFPPNSNDDLPPIIGEIHNVTQMKGNEYSDFQFNSDTNDSVSILPPPSLELPLPDTLSPVPTSSNDQLQVPSVPAHDQLTVEQQLPPDIKANTEPNIADMQLLPPIGDTTAIRSDTTTTDPSSSLLLPALPLTDIDIDSFTTQLPPLPDIPDPLPTLEQQQTTTSPTMIEVQVLRQNLPTPTSTDHIASPIDGLQYLLANDDHVSTTLLNDADPDWLTKQTGIEQLRHFLIDAST